MERLVLEDGEDKLDYIFTVDIFNEGVDIPEVQSGYHAAPDGISHCIRAAAGPRIAESG